MTIYTQYNSNSPDIVEEIEEAAENQMVIARQHRHFIDYSSGELMSDPEWDLAPLAPLLEGMMEEDTFGTVYDYLPDKFSFDMYGTHELWPIIMRANGATDRSQFRGPMIRFMTPTKTMNLLPMLRFGLARAQRADDLGPPRLGDLTVRKVYA